MTNFVIRWLVNILAIFLVINIVAGVSADSWQAIIVAAFILGLLNTFLKPVIVLLTLPFTVLTLGVFTLFINGLMFYLAAKFVKGFHVLDFWNAFWAAIVFSIISFIVNMFLSPSLTVRTQAFRSAPPRQPERYDNVIDVEGKVGDKKEDA
jgi:putative membrane protein